jgi:hypothetical protein
VSAGFCFKSAFCALLDHPDRDVRAYAIETLGVIGDEQVIPLLVPLLSGAEDETRVVIGEALEAIGDASAIADLPWVTALFYFLSRRTDSPVPSPVSRRRRKTLRVSFANAHPDQRGDRANH